VKSYIYDPIWEKNAHNFKFSTLSPLLPPNLRGRFFSPIPLLPVTQSINLFRLLGNHPNGVNTAGKPTQESEQDINKQRWTYSHCEENA
jgi:hypothetical protein